MKKIKFLLILLIASCQPQKETIKETVIIQPNSQQTGNDNQAGGGNCIGSQCLENYIEPYLEQMPAYAQKITPLIDLLAEKFPRLAADIYHISHQRLWYFVPGDLDSIPREKLGVYSKTDQVALQSYDEVYIDKSKFSQLDDNAKSTLLLHEMIMGLTLLQYQNRADRCVAKAALYMIKNPDPKKYSEEVVYCRKTYPDRTKIKFQLNSEDYTMVRKIVFLLSQPNVDTQDIQSLLVDYKIRDYSD